MKTKSEWTVPLLLVGLSLVPGIAGIARLADLAGHTEVTTANARFHSQPWPVVLHIGSVLPFSLLGAFQFMPSLRMRGSRWHRLVGRLLMPCGFVVALSGLWMTQFYEWPLGDGFVLYLLRLFFGSAMLIALSLSVLALMQHKYARHGRWMTRAYAIALGAGTQVLTHLPWFILVGQPDEATRAVLMGAGWLINVAVAEWAIRRV